MKITIEKAVLALDAINALIESDKTNKFVFSSATRLKLASSRRSIRPIVEDFMQERVELIKKYGTPLPSDQNQFKIPDENKAEFETALKAAIGVEEEVALNPIAFKDLGENQVPIDIIDLLMETGIVTE